MMPEAHCECIAPVNIMAWARIASVAMNEDVRFGQPIELITFVLKMAVAKRE